jgi:hypothetical protein
LALNAICRSKNGQSEWRNGWLMAQDAEATTDFKSGVQELNIRKMAIT